MRMENEDYKGLLPSCLGQWAMVECRQSSLKTLLRSRELARALIGQFNNLPRSIGGWDANVVIDRLKVWSRKH